MEKYINIKGFEDINELEYYYLINEHVSLKNYKRPTKEKLDKLLKDFKDNFYASEYFNIYLTGRFNSNQYSNTWDIDLCLTFKNITYKNYEYIYDALYYLKIVGLEKYELLIDPNYSDIIIFDSHIINSNMINKENHEISKYIKNMKSKEGEHITIFKHNVKKCVNDHFNQELNDKIVKKIINVNDKKLYIINYDLLLLDVDIIKKKKYIFNGCIYCKPIKIFN